MYVDRGRQISIAVFLLALAGVLLAAAPSFFSLGNFKDILVNISYVAIAALGMMMVILTGQIDISVGAILSICSTLAATASKAGLPLGAVFLISIGAGAALGLVNGLLVTRFKIHSIIVTLGTLSVFRGALIYFTKGAWIYQLPEDFRRVGLGTFLGIPYPIWALALVLLLGAWVLSSTPWGRALYAVGSNPEAARLSGIRVPFVQASAFVACGALVGLATMFYATRFSTIQSNTGQGFEFLVITAVVVGGVNVFGGSGTVLGVALGALLVGVTGTALTFLRISAYWEQALQGLFILLAVAFDAVRAQRRRFASRRARGGT
ncbi:MULTISPECIES: ABC transporter permease [unclassified Meiothermus]|uniref:ABC transporter permease n=1 Tax=unclassified Meiothermus TaxID=370471 RepID=UPI000D7D1FD5|nr:MULTISPECIES: ABC transporter permease [unclassified Meiothermus]PZA05746.1 ABC transporter permease [Meiothermus sp. Pnk-1]RYM30765.1 ABC transporter permease [Meiothermus sp. PNK-Is4]